MFWIGTAIFGAIVVFYGRATIKTKYIKFRELNKLVSSKYKPISMILWISLCMIAKMYWIIFLQWCNNTIEHLDNKTVSISYVLQGKLYKLVVKPRKGPNNVLLVLDEENNDITDLVLPFLGPNLDWHKKEFTPHFWKKKTISFELSTGEQKTFSEHDTIQL